MQKNYLHFFLYTIVSLVFTMFVMHTYTFLLGEMVKCRSYSSKKDNEKSALRVTVLSTVVYSFQIFRDETLNTPC